MKEKNSYIVDLFKRLTKTSKASVVLYLVLNVGIVTGILWAFGIPLARSVLLGMLLYGIGVAVALSPVGEALLRFQTGCKKITDEKEKKYIMPLFLEVYARSRIKAPSIPEDVRLFINKEETPNAFATGRKTICVTRGIMKLPPAQIKAVLAHEFGHLAHKDTDMILLVSAGNLFVSVLISMFRIMLSIFSAVVRGLLVMKSSRENEYEADAFARKLGYGEALCACLSRTSDGMARGFFATLLSGHPISEDRIEKLRQSEESDQN